MRVSMRAVIQRINRRLARDGERLHRYRGGRWSTDLGEFYIVDEYRNFLVQGHVDPEALGRELGVLRKSDVVIDPRCGSAGWSVPAGK